MVHASNLTFTRYTYSLVRVYWLVAANSAPNSRLRSAYIACTGANIKLIRTTLNDSDLNQSIRLIHVWRMPVLTCDVHGSRSLALAPWDLGLGTTPVLRT